MIVTAYDERGKLARNVGAAVSEVSGFPRHQQEPQASAVEACATCHTKTTYPFTPLLSGAREPAQLAREDLQRVR